MREICKYLVMAIQGVGNGSDLWGLSVRRHGLSFQQDVLSLVLSHIRFIRAGFSFSLRLEKD